MKCGWAYLEDRTVVLVPVTIKSPYVLWTYINHWSTSMERLEKKELYSQCLHFHSRHSRRSRVLYEEISRIARNKRNNNTLKGGWEDWCQNRGDEDNNRNQGPGTLHDTAKAYGPMGLHGLRRFGLKTEWRTEKIRAAHTLALWVDDQGVFTNQCGSETTKARCWGMETIAAKS